MLCPMSLEEVPGRMVSSLGRVTMCSGRVHSGYLCQDGYFSTLYSTSSGPKRQRVHRLVALAFLGGPPSPERSHVNHKDGDKENNTVTNLEYVTPAENRAHYLENRVANSQRKGRSDSKPVWSRACSSRDEWTWHPSIRNAAEVLGLDRSAVSRCCRCVQHQTGGYEFRAEVFQPLPGEEWREVNLPALVDEKKKRMKARSRQGCFDNNLRIRKQHAASA